MTHDLSKPPLAQEAPRKESESKEDLGRAVHRLSRVIGFQRKLLDQHPIHADLFAESEAIAAWPFVSWAYPLIEQSFKCLLKLREISYPCGGFQGHLIYHKLFKAMSGDDKAVVRDSYKAYRSLHDYIPPCTADKFLRSIGKGYNKWRYFLLEGGQVPTTHPGAMLEIAYATIDLLRAEVLTDHGIHTVDRRISFTIERLIKLEAWLKCAENLSLGREEIQDLQNWMNGYPNRIDAFAALIRLHHSETIDRIPVLPNTRRVLEEAIRMADRKTGQDFRHFLCRARYGNRPLVWNNDEGVFKQ